MILHDKYKLIRLIGEGGFGEVYEGLDLRLKRKVAVKLLKQDVSQRTEIAERFLKEAQLTSQLRHSNTLTIFDFGEHEGRLFLVSELLIGESLSQRLKRCKLLDLDQTIRLFIPLCHALSEAHKLGVIHRDLKPDNLFLHKTEEEERLILIDFGIAKSMSDIHLTQTGQIFGTPHYMAPEQIRESKEVTYHADLYSLGVVLYETISGRRPFVGESLYDIFEEHIKGTPPSLIELGLNKEGVFDPLIMRLLSKDPSHRPVSAREVGLVLTEIGQSFGIDFNATPEAKVETLSLQERIHLEDSSMKTDVSNTLDPITKPISQEMLTAETMALDFIYSEGKNPQNIVEETIGHFETIDPSKSAHLVSDETSNLISDETSKLSEVTELDPLKEDDASRGNAPFEATIPLSRDEELNAFDEELSEDVLSPNGTVYKSKKHLWFALMMCMLIGLIAVTKLSSQNDLGDQRAVGSTPTIEESKSHQIEAQRLEAQRLEAQRLEAQRLKAQKREAQRREAQKLKTLQTKLNSSSKTRSSSKKKRSNSFSILLSPASSSYKPGERTLLRLKLKRPTKHSLKDVRVSVPKKLGRFTPFSKVKEGHAYGEVTWAAQGKGKIKVCLKRECHYKKVLVVDLMKIDL